MPTNPKGTKKYRNHTMGKVTKMVAMIRPGSAKVTALASHRFKVEAGRRAAVGKVGRLGGRTVGPDSGDGE
jgi:hypothetical protein